MISAKEFRNTYIGKSIDVDGAAGVQCVDLFKQCCYLAGKKAFSLGGSGYADEIIHRFTALGLDDYFTKVSLSDAQYGDWCVWDKGSKEAPDSHVAMFEEWDGSSRAIFLGQNQGGVAKATEISISTSGIIGVLRLKAWKTSSATSTKYKVGDTVTINGVYTSSTSTKKQTPAVKSGKITKIIAGADNPYLLNNGDIGWVNDKCIVSKSSGSTSSKKKSVYLPKTATSWRVYKTNVAPVVGNECGYLYPSKFGGLTYEILATPQTDVVTIQTRDYGKVNIYVAKSTGAVIK